MLKNKADPNLKSGIQRDIILHYFIGDIDILKLLIKYGADVNALNNQGTSALYSFEADIRCISYLLDHGAKIDQVNIWGETPLSRTVENAVTLSSGFKYLNSIELYLARGATITVKLTEYLALSDDTDTTKIIKDLVKMSEQIDNLLGKTQDCIVDTQINVDSSLLDNRFKCLMNKQINQIWQGNLPLADTQKSSLNKISDCFYNLFTKTNYHEVAMSKISSQIQKTMNNLHKNLQDNNY